jgi:hypothetical protein
MLGARVVLAVPERRVPERRATRTTRRRAEAARGALRLPEAEARLAGVSERDIRDGGDGRDDALSVPRVDCKTRQTRPVDEAPPRFRPLGLFFGVFFPLFSRSRLFGEVRRVERVVRLGDKRGDKRVFVAVPVPLVVVVLALARPLDPLPVRPVKERVRLDLGGAQPRPESIVHLRL